METMNDLQLLKTLELYLDDTTYDYAVMIDGPWGSGKSFFLKKKFFPKLDEMKRKYIFISLYGANSINEINKQVYLQNILGNENVNSKAKFFGFAGSLAYDYLDKKGVNVNSVQDAITIVKDRIAIDEKTVLIFDDFERTKINVAELLGFINGFVEQQHLKTIIICNEKEIDDTLNNLELKYLVASKDIISFPKSVSNEDYFKSLGRYSESDNKDNNDFKELISIEELNNRVNELFDEKTKYKKIKEKIIGNTYYYSCDLGSSCFSILHSLNDLIISKDTKYDLFFEIMEESIPLLSEEMNKLKHYNLRTFQFFLSKMFQFYKNILDVESSLVDSVFKENLLFSLKESIYYKNGESKSTNLNCVESEIVDFITGKKIMNESFIRTIFYNYQILTSKGKIETNIHIIYNWVKYNSKIINDTLIYLINHVEEINHVYYKMLLTSLATVEYYRIVDSNLIDSFVNCIHEKLLRNSDFKQLINELEFTVFELQEEKDIYARYINKLSTPKKQLIENPFEKWINDSDYHLPAFNKINVYDCVYLNEENILQIFSQIKIVEKALPIWNLYNIFEFIFIDSFSVWSYACFRNVNINSIGILSEKLKEYIENENNIDKVIVCSIQRLISRLDHIVEKYTKRQI